MEPNKELSEHDKKSAAATRTKKPLWMYSVEHRRKHPVSSTHKAMHCRNALMVALSADVLDDKGRPTKALRIVIDKLVEAAKAGEPWAVKEVFDRIDGKPNQTLLGDPDAPLGGGGIVGQILMQSVGGGEPVDLMHRYKQAAEPEVVDQPKQEAAE